MKRIITIISAVFCIAACTPKAPATVSVTEVTLDETAVTLYVGDEIRLTATVLPDNATNKDVTWASNNTAAASVVDGVVTGIAPGPATITVTTADGGKTASCTVNVENAPIPVESVSLNEAPAEIEVEQTFQLVATVLPDEATNKTITWSTSDNGKASVSAEGLVTALATGQVTITASADGGKTASCTFTVIPKYVAVTSLTLDLPTKTCAIGDSFALTPTVGPDEATAKEVTWTSSAPAVATVANGTVSVVGSGRAVITASVKDGLTATCIVSVPYSLGEGSGNHEGFTDGGKYNWQ